MKFQRMIRALQFNRFFWGGCVFILLLNLAFYVVVIERQRDRMARLETVYSKKRNPVGLRAEGERIAGYRIAGEEVKLFEAGLPPKEKFVQRLKEMHDLLERHGLTMDRITFKPKAVGALKLWKYTSSFSVSGRYAQLKGFIADLQNSPNLFCLEKLSFINRSSTRELVNMKLEVSTYFK